MIVKWVTLQNLSTETGDFIPHGTHTNLKEVFSQVVGSLYFLLRVREATAERKTSRVRLAEAQAQLIAAQDAEGEQVCQSTAAKSGLNGARGQAVIAQRLLQRAVRAVQTAEEKYLALKAERGKHPLFQHRTVYDALQAGRKDFDLFALQDRAFGAKVVRDRLWFNRTR